MKRVAIVTGLILAALALLLAYAARPLFTDLGPARSASQTAIVIVSGDTGFRFGLSHALAERLVDKHFHVVGVNSLHFAWRAQTPENIANLLQTAILRALRDGQAGKVIVIGQSYGADLVHLGAASLPDALRRKMAAIILVVPTSDVYYQIGPREYFGVGMPDAKAIDTARQIDWTPVTCIYGREERDSICPLMHRRNVRRVALPGDHYLHRDADRLFRAAWPAIRAAALRP
jgi:type IV secretory pathway VirJ component